MTTIPPVTMTAVGSGRVLHLDRLDVPAVLFFLWRDTTHLAERINLAVRGRYPLAEQLVVINVADLRGVPRIVHRLVAHELERAYRDIASQLPATLDPADFVLIVPDWQGSVPRAVGLPGPVRRPSVAVVDAGGRLLGTHQGTDLAEAALALLEREGKGDRQGGPATG